MNVFLNQRKHTARRNQTGFTLLEMMVAMTVLTLMMTVAFGALRAGERSWETGLRYTAKTENLRTVTGAMQRLFAQLMPLSWEENSETTIAFAGDIEKLSFIAPAPQHHGATGLFEYTLALEPDASDNRLMLYYRLHDPDNMGFSAIDDDRQEVLLVDKLSSASFSYYGSQIADEPAEWHTYWDSDAETFPHMVQVKLVANNERDQWPDLFLTLRAEAEK